MKKLALIIVSMITSTVCLAQDDVDTRYDKMTGGELADVLFREYIKEPADFMKAGNQLMQDESRSIEDKISILKKVFEKVTLQKNEQDKQINQQKEKLVWKVLGVLSLGMGLLSVGIICYQVKLIREVLRL